MVDWKKSFNQPAKLAERVLAPGDGEAEPGGSSPTWSQPTKWATDETCKQVGLARLPSVARFAGFWKLAVTPGSASPSPGASTLSASFAGWLNDSLTNDDQ